jgi:UDP-N-acetylglucosamine 2-epimerase
MALAHNPYGDGNAAIKIAKTVSTWLMDQNNNAADRAS